MTRNNTVASVTAALAGLSLLIGACGGGGYGGTAPSTATGAATASPVIGSAPPAATAAPAELTLVASSIRFDTQSLRAPAGEVAIAFSNRDQGIAHNVHVFRGSDASGEDVASAQIQTGPSQQTLALGKLAPGSYFYHCDVHPDQMMGTLTVT